MSSLFAISDLHLCDKGSRDNFAVRGEDRLLRFLDYVDHEQGTLLVLGDLFDVWQCNFSASVMAYQKLLRALACVGPLGARWVVGNHDGLLVKFLGTGIQLVNACLPTMSGPFEVTVGGRRYAFAHGHEFDNTCNSLNPGIGELTAIISGMLEDRKGPDTGTTEDRFIGSLEFPLNLWRAVSHQVSRDEEMLNNAITYRKEAGADTLVYGHTHTAGRVGDSIFNTGCWCRDTDTFIRINDGVPSLWVWDDDRAAPFEKELQ